MGKNDFPIYINGKEIMRTQNHMYLGKIIEEKGKHKEDIKETEESNFTINTEYKCSQGKKIKQKKN